MLLVSLSESYLPMTTDPGTVLMAGLIFRVYVQFNKIKSYLFFEENESVNK